MRHTTSNRRTFSLSHAIFVASIVMGYGCENPADNPIRTPRPTQDATVKKEHKKPPRGNRECLALVGGNVSKDEPQTALLIGNLRGNNYTICSGTWVSDTTMITASHCLEDTETGGMSYVPGAGEIVTASDIELLLESSVKPIKAIIGAPEFTIDRFDQTAFAEGMHRDLAVLVFPPRTAPAYVPVLERAVKPEEELTIVGYGAINVPGAGQRLSANEIDIRRRRGKNTLIPEPKLEDPGFEQLQAYLQYNLYNIKGAAVSDGQTETTEAVIGQGDSGGPMLVGSALSGVAVVGGVIPFRLRRFLDGATGIGHVAPLNSSFATSLMKTAEDKGARISRVKEPQEAKIMIPGKDDSKGDNKPSDDMNPVDPVKPSDGQPEAEPIDDLVEDANQKSGSDDESCASE